jgi:WD40 repeat protein
MLLARPAFAEAAGVLAREYVAACRDAETAHTERERRQTRLRARLQALVSVLTSLTACIVLAAGVIATRLIAGFNERRFETLVNLGEQALEEGRPERAARYFVAAMDGHQAWFIGFDPAKAEAGLARLADRPALQHIVQDLRAKPVRVETSSGPRLLGVSFANKPFVWDARDHRLLSKGDPGWPVAIRCITRSDLRFSDTKLDEQSNGCLVHPALAKIAWKPGKWPQAYMSANGRTIVTMTDSNALGEVPSVTQVWDSTTGTELARFGEVDEDGKTSGILISPDGLRVVLRVDRHTVIWNAESRTMLATISMNPDGYVLSHDGTRLLLTSRVGDLHETSLWDVTNGKQVGELLRLNVKMLTDPDLVSCAFDQTGARVFCPDGLGGLSVFDAQTGTEQEALDFSRLHGNSPSGHIRMIPLDIAGWLLVQHENGSLALVDTRDGGRTLSLKVDGNFKPIATVLTADSSVLAIADRKVVYVFDVVSGALRYNYVSLSDDIRAITFVDDSGMLLAVIGNGTAEIVRPPSDALVRRIPASYDSVATVSPDDGTIIIADSNGIRFHAAVDGAVQRDLSGLPRATTLAFSTSGKALALGSAQAVQVLDPISGIVKQRLRTQFARVHAVALSANGQVVAAASTQSVPGDQDRLEFAVEAFDVASGVRRWITRDRFEVMAFDDTGRFLLLYNIPWRGKRSDRKPRVLTTETGNPAQSPPPIEAFKLPYNAMSGKWRVIYEGSRKPVVKLVNANGQDFGTLGDWAALTPRADRAIVRRGGHGYALVDLSFKTGLSGSALVREACHRFLPEPLSRFGEVELRLAPVLDREREIDACRPTPIGRKLASLLGIIPKTKGK